MRGRHPDRPSCGPSILVYRVYKCRTGPKPLLDLARPAGIEPATPAFGEPRNMFFEVSWCIFLLKNQLLM